MTFDEFLKKADILNAEVLIRQGCYTKFRLWLRGWPAVPADNNAAVRYINGLTGRETEITYVEIRPSRSFQS